MASSGMTDCARGMRILGISLGILAAIAVIANLKDVARYIRIASM